MSTERKRRAEIVRLILATRERFPHNPRLNAALRRLMWRYVGAPAPAPARRKRRTRR